MLSLKTHSVLDYVAGFALIISPYLFGFADIDVARNVLVTLGVILIGYSLITRYRYSVAKIVPLGVHMALDVAIGVITLLAPSIWDYRELLTGLQNGLHYVLGIGAIALVAFTSKKSERQAVGMESDEQTRLRRVA